MKTVQLWGRISTDSEKDAWTVLFGCIEQLQTWSAAMAKGFGIRSTTCRGLSKLAQCELISFGHLRAAWDWIIVAEDRSLGMVHDTWFWPGSDMFEDKWRESRNRARLSVPSFIEILDMVSYKGHAISLSDPLSTARALNDGDFRQLRGVQNKMVRGYNWLYTTYIMLGGGLSPVSGSLVEIQWTPDLHPNLAGRAVHLPEYFQWLLICWNVIQGHSYALTMSSYFFGGPTDASASPLGCFDCNQIFGPLMARAVDSASILIFRNPRKRLTRTFLWLGLPSS